MRRIIFAFLLAPALGLAALELWIAYQGGGFHLGGTVVLFGSVFAYPSAVLFGIPLFLICLRRGFLNWWSVPITAVLAGLPAAILLAWLTGKPVNFNAIAEAATLTSLVGFSTGMFFWLIAVRGNSALTAAFTPSRAEAARPGDAAS
jgi:hypothetical protein